MPGTVLGAGDSKRDKVQTLPLRSYISLGEGQTYKQ